MRKGRFWSIIAVALLTLVSATLASAGYGNYRTHLSGDNEVPPAGVVVATLAQGQAIFKLNEDGTAVNYKLIVANIDNVFMAHIHKAGSSANGPIAVWLYPGTAPAPGPTGQGRTDGVLVEGSFTAANLVNQAATGITTLEQLLTEIENGNAYVNVHTNDGVAPPNTGPGDFPGGEIRGQIH